MKLKESLKKVTKGIVRLTKNSPEIQKGTKYNPDVQHYYYNYERGGF